MKRLISSNDELERLATLLQDLSDSLPDDEAVPLDLLDGYLTALISGPKLCTPMDALAGLFGEEWANAFKDTADMQEFVALTTQRWNVIASQIHPDRLMQSPDDLSLSPLITELPPELRDEMIEKGLMTAEDADLLPAPGALWAEGYLLAIDTHQDSWSIKDPESEAGVLFDELLNAISALMLPEGEERNDYLQATYERLDVSQDELLNDALFAAQDMRLFWLHYAPKTEPIRREALPGRNDPCPCGSGKKFKHCHGAPGALH
jgi:uncharacterized protein